MMFFGSSRQVLVIISVIFLLVFLNRAIPDPFGQNAPTPIQEDKKSIESKRDSAAAPSLSEEEIPLTPPKIEIKLRPPEENKLKRVVTNRSFGVGERLEFSVGYGMINAGTAVMEIPDMAKLDGSKCFHIVSTAQSNKVFSVFFKVDDKNFLVGGGAAHQGELKTYENTLLAILQSITYKAPAATPQPTTTG